MIVIWDVCRQAKMREWNVYMIWENGMFIWWGYLIRNIDG
jgi:hypothetical protein